MSNKVNLIGFAKNKLIEQKLKPIHEILDEYRNDVVAIHKAGFTWQQTAQHVNEAFGLKGDKRMTQRTISMLVKKWQALNWIDTVKVEALAKDLTRAEQEALHPRQSSEHVKVVSPTSVEVTKPSFTPTASKPNYQSTEWQNGTYTTKDEFITEIRDTTTLRHEFNQTIADEIWAVYPGKSRKLVMSAYINKVSDSTKK